MGVFENVNPDAFDSFLIEGVNPVEPGLEGAVLDDDTNDYTLTPADESAIFLETLASECDTPDEFFSMVEENAVTWEMYGMIEDASAALEAVKRMKVENWKQVNLSRVTGNQAIRMAAAANSSDYKKYKKYRALYKKYKAKIEKKYSVRAKSVARRSIMNSQHKASSAKNNAASAGISKKMDNAIKNLDKNGRNGSAITEKGK